MGVRSSIYKVKGMWNGVDAVKERKAGKRTGRKAAGKRVGKLLRKIFK